MGGWVVKERNVVSADGVPLHVLDVGGSGQPIVLLHGGGRSVADWTDEPHG